jgi:TM2 domain-containing membrane protein YozV
MKSKSTAALLAFFFGWIGAHRFYLGQKVLGVLYIILFFTFGISFIIAMIDFFGLLAMKRERFDYLYNRMYFDEDYQDFVQKRYRHYKGAAPKKTMIKKREKSRRPVKTTREAVVQLKKDGKEHFKNYQYQEAVDLFEKVLEIDSRDAAIHFNLACTFSLLENKERAYRHLSLAVENGFDDIKRIKEHPALAWVRVQSDWDQFANRGFREGQLLEEGKEDLLSRKEGKESGDVMESTGEGGGKDGKILVQLRKLKDMRDRGVISDLEFKQRRKELL